MAAITAIELSESSIQLVIEGTKEITITKTPEDGEGTIVWESSNEDVATVSDGTITAVAEGEAVITAKVEGTEIEASVNVTVIGELKTPMFELDYGKIPMAVLYANTKKTM